MDEGDKPALPDQERLILIYKEYKTSGMQVISAVEKRGEAYPKKLVTKEVLSKDSVAIIAGQIPEVISVADVEYMIAAYTNICIESAVSAMEWRQNNLTDRRPMKDNLDLLEPLHKVLIEANNRFSKLLQANSELAAEIATKSLKNAEKKLPSTNRSIKEPQTDTEWAQYYLSASVIKIDAMLKDLKEYLGTHMPVTPYR